MARKISLKKSVKIRDKVWEAGTYEIPNEMPGDLADWLLYRRPDITVEVGGPEIEEIDQPEHTKGASPTQQKTAFDRLLELVGSHLVEIYSDTGNGKSRLVYHIATEAERSGKKVLYLDTEKSLPVGYEKSLKNYEVHTAKT
ncbi:MAG: hypothetical protein HWN68_20850, partial [Desulfobacterales bacterium]|nr:hypothetical protein [Desulfobacterales bacterium]